MIRSSITPQQADIIISIPTQYIGKKLEVLLFAVEEVDIPEEKLTPVTMAQFWGVLSNETADDLREQVAKSRNEWDRNI